MKGKWETARFAEERTDIGRHSFLTKGKNWLDLSHSGEYNSYDIF